jgi:tRNA-2-methylthio-N6-dimethylallyladenosine synthase
VTESTGLIPLRRKGVARAAGTSPVPVTRRAFIETYGCQMNIGDSELMAGALARRGYVTVDDPERADVIVINTCAIREHAETRVLGRIGQLQVHRRSNPELVLAVTGCMAQRLGETLLDKAAGVDVVAGPDSYRKLGEVVDELRLGSVPRGQLLLALDETEDYEGVEAIRRGGVTAWVTIQRGCDHRCTFCIVPYVRGGEKNREPAAVLREVRNAVTAGYSEVTLLGQTVNSYRHGDWDFARLLRAVARLEGVRRVRFTSPHPNDVTDDMLRVMAEESAVCPQLHLPVQSGSDRVLKRMVRRYTAREFLETVDRVRARVSGIALSTDVIVGFPGETEEDFDATLALLGRVRFDDAFLYRYSPRDGTPATRLPTGEFVDESTSGRRLDEVISLHRTIQREINEAEVGSEQEVLVERPARSEGDILGRTATGKVVAFAGPVEWRNSYRTVRMTSTSGPTFGGEAVL